LGSGDILNAECDLQTSLEFHRSELVFMCDNTPTDAVVVGYNYTNANHPILEVMDQVRQECKTFRDSGLGVLLIIELFFIATICFYIQTRIRCYDEHDRQLETGSWTYANVSKPSAERCIISFLIIGASAVNIAVSWFARSGASSALCNWVPGIEFAWAAFSNFNLVFLLVNVALLPVSLYRYFSFTQAFDAFLLEIVIPNYDRYDFRQQRLLNALPSSQDPMFRKVSEFAVEYDTGRLFIDLPIASYVSRTGQRH
jgi:hypothetical protein